MDSKAAHEFVVLQKRRRAWVQQKGSFTTQNEVTIAHMVLPQFTQNREFEGKFAVAKKEEGDRYDFVLERDTLTKLGLIINYKKKHLNGMT